MPSDARPDGPADRLALPPFLWLVALAGLAVVLVLEPLGTYAVFGSDTGEYVRLTSAIASTGHLPGAYGGWGSAYPDFPGIFLLATATAGVTGANVLTSLALVVPVVAALSVLPLFLLLRRIFPNDTIALLGAGFATVAFPRIFSLAHPAPLALGDFLVVAALWMFVEGRRDLRWYGPLALTAAALVVTHHLSSYFFLVSAIGSVVLLELYRPGLWSRRFPDRELAFTGAMVVGLLAFWFVYAKSFLPTVSRGAVGTGPLELLLFEAAAIAGFVGLTLLLRWRRARRWPRPKVTFPSDRSTVRDFGLLVAATFGGVLLLTVVPLPGTTQETTVAAVVLFAPILLFVPLAAGTRRIVSAARLGPLGLTWLAAVGLSALAAIATGTSVISPARHAEYLVIPLGLLAAIGLGRLVARGADAWGRPALLAGVAAGVLLLAGNAAIAYPPPADFGGFQEGLTPADAALWGWAAQGLPPPTIVASDHRLSSMLFGFDGLRATWDSTPALFVGSNWSAAEAELNASLAPHGPPLYPLDAVAIDATMRTSGVALNPSAPAAPMSAAARAWFDRAPFVPIYENGLQSVYWVDGPFGPGVST